MSDVDRRFHEVWLGMAQPIDGLVVSVPVLVEAQCLERQPPQVQQKLVALCPPTREGDAGPEGFAVASLGQFLGEVLGLGPELFDAEDAIPEELSLYVPEGKQTLRPTLALRKQGTSRPADGVVLEGAARAGASYEMLIWEVPPELDLDRSESVTGPWDYPPAAKLDRLLRHCRVPIGLLTNRAAFRLIYAPHGESSGSITFRIDDMASVGGRPILDAFVMLLSANRFFGVAPERALPALLTESRKRQANVTNELADQVFAALQILLRGFEAAASRDGSDLLDDALARENDHLYKGLLTVLLRLVFLLFAEDRALLPVEHRLYAEHLSVSSLFGQLQVDHGAYPDSMSRRFGAWGRLVTCFRAVYLGLSHGDLLMPPRNGSLFDPHEHPFLEGWGPAGSAPITGAEDRAAVKLPTVDDETIFRVLEKLLVFEGQRLSYRALDVEQIGSVYEALMGYHVLRVAAESVCLKRDRLWVSAEEVMAVPAPRRAKWLKETIGLNAAQSEKLQAEIAAAEAGASKANDVLEALSRHAAGGKKADPSLSRARAGHLVLQPGSERRRTSSHYTPRSLSAPIVRRTLEPLLAVMGDAPASERILNLKVCDPAMGSGAFLVEACRFLADQVLAAWTREGRVEAMGAEHCDPLLHARRLVAQRCLYGVDKNAAAVELAKLSLWLVTLSRTLPFTFLDHSLRHGDSLVGLDFDQIRAFHWKRPEEEKDGKGKKASKQLELFGREIDVALQDAIALRQKIGDLGDTPVDDREKARLFWDAQDALERVRLIGDLVVGAFFAHEKERDREGERARREGLVRAWLTTGDPPTEELLAMQRSIRERLPVFHWMVELPEVFYAERPDPLDADQVNRAAYMDAFVGNPPFLGGKRISTELGDRFGDWVSAAYETSKNTDLCVYFFRAAFALLGAHGAVGFVATNSVAQGDNRPAGLGWLLSHGASIASAVRSMPWPGEAAVSISLVHLVRGAVSARAPTLDGHVCAAINSRLLEGPERNDAATLATNRERCFSGSYVGGLGFFLAPDEASRLLAADPRAAEILRDYIGGEEITTLPDASPQRVVINFENRTLDEARGWPSLLAIVDHKVRADREATRLTTGPGGHGKKYWWQFISRCDPLYDAIRRLRRCLVVPQVAKHLVFSWQPSSRVFGNSSYVITFDEDAVFAVVQSRVHEAWVRLLSSTMEDRLRYMPTDCFENFPFPQPDPRAVIASLEDMGQRLYDLRAKYMVDENVGLTVTYNRLKDPSHTEPRILELRALHEETDRAVLAAYAEGDPEGRWLDVEVPPYCPLDDEGKKKLDAFGDTVIDRLFVLNANRAEEEKLRGLGDARIAKAAGKATKAPAATKGAAPKGRKGTSAAGPRTGEAQLTLGAAAADEDAEG